MLLDGKFNMKGKYKMSRWVIKIPVKGTSLDNGHYENEESNIGFVIDASCFSDAVITFERALTTVLHNADSSIHKITE